MVFMGTRVRYAPAVRERAVRLVFEVAADHKSQWAAIVSVAQKVGCAPETLRKWVRRVELLEVPAERERLADKSRVVELERENRELREANEILRKAAAFFAQAELGRPRK